MKKVFWLSFCLLTGSYITAPLRDPDLWWHLTIGKWILYNKNVPHVDHWNMFYAGKPWTAYSWSHEVLYAFFERCFGIEGVYILQILFALILSLTLFFCLSKLAGDWFFGSLLGALTVCTCVGHFGLRPQTFVWILLSFLLLVLETIRQKGFTYRRGIALLCIMSLWANAHITTIIGILLIGLWCIPSTFPKNSLSGFFRHKRIQDSIKSLLFGFIGTLITPYFGYEWIIFFLKSGHPLSHSSIIEFGPATIHDYGTAIMLLLGILLFYLLHLYHEKEDTIKISENSALLQNNTLAQKIGVYFPLIHFFLVIFFIVGGLGVAKFIPFASIITASVLASFWSKIRSHHETSSTNGKLQISNFETAIYKFKEQIEKISGQGAAFLLLVLTFMNLRTSYIEGIDKSITPVQAFDYILNEKLPFPILNAFGTGGYLMYRLSDEKGIPLQLASIDGRTNVNPHEIVVAESEAFFGKERWRDYLSIVNPNTVLWRNGSSFGPLLIASDEWCRVYNSKSNYNQGFSVYVRKTAQNKHFYTSCDKEIYTNHSTSKESVTHND
jgi:hypothetical protein